MYVKESQLQEKLKLSGKELEEFLASQKGKEFLERTNWNELEAGAMRIADLEAEANRKVDLEVEAKWKRWS